MNMENTRKRFKERIAFERRILSAVNQNSNLTNSLNGLSQSAIDLWKEKNVSSDYTSQVHKILNELSKNLLTYCDTSKSSFDQEENIDSKFLKKKILMLQKVVAIKKQS